MKKTHNAVVKYIVTKVGESESFSVFRKSNFASEEEAEAAIIKFIEQADGFAGCSDLCVRKIYHAEYIR